MLRVFLWRMKMSKNIAVRMKNNIFCGEIISVIIENQKKRLLLKQSEKSEILLNIPINKIRSVVTMDAAEYSGEEEISRLLSQLTI